MEKFIMREDLKKLRQYADEERFADMQEMFNWTKALTQSGYHVNSEPLAICGSYVEKPTFNFDAAACQILTLHANGRLK